VRDPGLERYASALEEHLGRRRGREHTLSPPDFALVRSWHARGVPLDDVIAAIDALVAEGRDPTSLAPCRRRIEAVDHRAPRAEALPAEPPASPVAPDRVRAIATALAAQSPALAARFSASRAVLEEVLARPAPEPALLERLESTLAREALAALEPAVRQQIERRVERAVARQRGRVEEEVLERARRQHLETAALRALGLLG